MLVSPSDLKVLDFTVMFWFVNFLLYLNTVYSIFV